jgi:hypothetical protein
LPSISAVRIASNAPDTGRKNKADYKIPDRTAMLVVVDARNAVANGKTITPPKD